MNLVYWPSPQSEKAQSIVSFGVSKAPERFGTFSPLTVVTPAYTGTWPAVVWTLQYFDAGGVASDWYKIDSLDAAGNVIATSVEHKGANTAASLIDLLWQLRSKVGDTCSPPAFADYELIAYLNEALTIHNRTKTWDTLDETEYPLIIWLTVANICISLAQDSAKYYPLSIDGTTIDKGNRVQHYKSIHDLYMERYKERKEAWHLEAEGAGYIQIGNMTRESGTTGRKTPYIHVLPPTPVKLFAGSVLTAGQVDLRWTQSDDDGFYYYVVFRSQAPNVQKRLIEDTYNKRIALYDDPGDFANSLWGGVTFPVIMLYRNSVTFWMDQNRSQPNPYYGGNAPSMRANTDYYYVVGVVTKNILLALSNEIHVRTPALAAPTITQPIRSVEGVVSGQGEPTANIFVSQSLDAGATWNQIATVPIKSASISTFYFQFGSGFLPVGSLIRIKQNFNGVDSPYTAPYTVL